MQKTKLWRQLLYTWTLLALLLANSVSSALAQAPQGTGGNPVYLPLISSGDNNATEATVADAAKKGGATDQIIVHYKNPAQFQAQATQLATLSQATGVNLAYVRALADQSVVVRLPKAMTATELRPVLARLAGLPEVAVVEPDVRVFPQVTPNDPRYGEQWHYWAPTARNYGANLPGAWDITTGAANVVVAVLDTGQLNHADLAGRLTPGYDFVTRLFIAHDGDGRDPDPSDPGDWCNSVSSWHGTHVAGTIGANSNNGLGVAGINWQSKIQHARVLGVCGGDISDITDGIRWAAGLSVPDAPPNPTPAKVLNLSLGGAGACGVGLQSAIDDAVKAGAVVVVSAGNDSADAADFLPANCNNVITVAATDRSGDMAHYSNYGSKIEIAAPGGETYLLEKKDGVLSTLNTGETVPEADTYGFYQGTSMAAPHVSGIVSLMLSVNPTLTPAQVVSILQSTATPFPAGSGCNTTTCGAGLVNAMAAVTRAKGGPMAPTNVQVASASATQITLRWNDNTSDETGFKVERCQGAGCTTFAQIGTAGANGTSYADTSVAANTSYSYRVRTTKNGVDSAPSNIATTNSGVAGCTVYNSSEGPKPIPDLGTVVSTLTVANSSALADVNVRNLNIEHPFDMDLSVVLVSPTGAQVELFNGVGASGADFSGTTLDDEATTSVVDGSAPFSGSYKPTSPLSAFDGQNPTGVWTLRVSDNIGVNDGWFYGWSLELCSSGSGGSSDLIFEDGFESGGFGRWTSTSTLDGGDLSVNATAALVGTRGMNVLIDDTVALYVTDDTPNAEPRYRARFKFDPNTLVLPNQQAHYIFYGYTGASMVVLRLEFRNYNGAYQVRTDLRNDGGAWTASSWYAITDAPHTLEFDWRAATALGANNGGLTLWIDGTQKSAITGIDNDTLRIDRIRLGAIAGLDVGTQGSYYFDGFKSTRQNYIGPTIAAASVESSDTAAITAVDANVVEEDLSLDDVGALAEEEGVKQQIFLPLIQQ